MLAESLSRRSTPTGGSKVKASPSCKQPVVETEVIELDDAHALNAGFTKRHRTGRPLVRVKVGASAGQVRTRDDFW